MFDFLLNLNLGLIITVSVIGLFCLALSNRLWQSYENRLVNNNSTSEYIFAYALKAFTILYLISITTLALSIPLSMLSAWSSIQTLPLEIATILTLGLLIIGVSGLAALYVAFQKPNLTLKNYISVSPMTEPSLHKMIAELAEHFRIEPIDDIRITPGSEIEIKEPARTFDDVFSKRPKLIEIGLASMQLLSAGELKVIIARQFAFYESDNHPPLDFIKKLNSRLELISNNISRGGLLFMLNPAAWIAAAMRPITSFITADYLLMTEFRADEIAAEYSGSKRLTGALARYNVETERYRELIDIATDFSRSGGGVLGSNIYDIMKRPRTESTDELKLMIDQLYTGTHLGRQDRGKRYLKLRLKRLPETADSPLDINLPATTWLTDWRATENRMMKLIKL